MIFIIYNYHSNHI